METGFRTVLIGCKIVGCDAERVAQRDWGYTTNYENVGKNDVLFFHPESGTSREIVSDFDSDMAEVIYSQLSIPTGTLTS